MASITTGAAMKSILDPSFRYVPSAETDIRKTFNRIRRELAKARPAASPARLSSARVVPFGRAKEYAAR